MAYTPIPANLYDYFSTINQRIRKLESAPDQAMTTATSAQSTAATASAQALQAATAAGIAQAQAITAQAQATVAYNSAIQSLQPSASTIVNASNQITAISTNGITVYSGSSSSSGARVVMNSAGIAGYNSSGSPTFSIDSSTGNATFSGNVTGSTIAGGSLNIAGNTTINYLGNGILIASGATITGTINATAGYFGTSSNGWSITSTGISGVGTATISGGSISGTSLNIGSGVFTVSSAGAVNASNIVATGGSIGGINMQSNAIYTGTSFATATSYWNNSGNSYFNNITINTNGNYLGTLTTGSATASSADTSITGIYSDNTGYLFVKGTHASLVYIHNQTASSATKMIQFQASGNAWGGIQMNGSASAPTFFTSSDYRLKENIQPYTGSIDLLNKLRVVSFNEKTDSNKKQIVGFIADEFATVFPDWVDGDKDAVDADGNPVYQTISTTNLINYLVGAIQELSTEVEKLKGANNGTTTSA